MTDKKILIKAIKVAAKNGYNGYRVEPIEDYFEFYGDSPSWYLDNGKQEEDNKDICIRDIIFDREFAKAFWGYEKVALRDWNLCNDNPLIEAWKYHLQQIILEEEPLKYLEKHLLVKTS